MKYEVTICLEHVVTLDFETQEDAEQAACDDCPRDDHTCIVSCTSRRLDDEEAEAA